MRKHLPFLNTHKKSVLEKHGKKAVLAGAVAVIGALQRKRSNKK